MRDESICRRTQQADLAIGIKYDKMGLSHPNVCL